MQEMIKKFRKKKKALVYKPFKRGTLFSKPAAKHGIRLSVYFFLFLFLYFTLRTILQFEAAFPRIVFNAALVIVCGLLVYADGTRQGQMEVTMGETALTREESGKTVTKEELGRCYRPAKAVLTAMLACLPVFVFALIFACSVQKQTYQLQGLPGWVHSMRDGYEDMAAPLTYYPTHVSLTFMDFLSIMIRALNLPFVSMVSGMGADAALIVDRLSPILVCLPMLGYPLGYLAGPRARAMVHGDISVSKKRHLKKQRKEIKARREHTQKKNQII